MKSLLKIGCGVLIVLLVLVCGGAALLPFLENQVVGVFEDIEESLAPLATSTAVPSAEKPLTPEEVKEDAEVAAQLQELRVNGERAEACGPMLNDLADVNTLLYETFVDFAVGDVTQSQALTYMNRGVQGLFGDHGAACGADAGLAMLDLFEVYYGLLDNPSPANVEAASLEIVEHTATLLEAASDYTGVSQ